MRPHSEARLDVAAALLDGGGTTRELAARTGWSVGAVRTALDNMVRAWPPQAMKRDPVRVPGVRRPVPWYERPADDELADGGDDDALPHVSLIEAWASPIRGGVMGAAM